jgi:beta-lactamase class A
MITPTFAQNPTPTPAAKVWPGLKLPEITGFRPLPPSDPEFSRQLEALVKEAGLDEKTPAEANPDKEDEWSSICVVDLRDLAHPRVGGWKEDNFVYPASAYKLYVLGEAARQIVAGEHSLDEVITVKERNVRSDSQLKAGQVITVSEILRLMAQHSDNSAANEAIDLVDRRRASALLRALGCGGSEVTRKYLARELEDEGYSSIISTTSCSRHFATFLWAVETGAIGGGRGRGLVKSYLGMIETGVKRIRAGLPASATAYTKSGTWSIFTCDVGIVEDGPVRYIICILTALPEQKAEPRIAQFSGKVHQLLSKR